MTDETQAAQEFVCSACEHRAAPADFVREEAIRPGAWQVVMVCPACGARTHVYYMTDALRGERQKLQRVLEAYQAEKGAPSWERYQTARAVFQRKFDKVQARWARKLGADHAVEV